VGFDGILEEKVKPKLYMNATINIICYKQKTLANGEHPIMIIGRHDK